MACKIGTGAFSCQNDLETRSLVEKLVDNQLLREVVGFVHLVLRNFRGDKTFNTKIKKSRNLKTGNSVESYTSLFCISIPVIRVSYRGQL